MRSDGLNEDERKAVTDVLREMLLDGAEWQRPLAQSHMATASRVFAGFAAMPCCLHPRHDRFEKSEAAHRQGRRRAAEQAAGHGVQEDGRSAGIYFLTAATCTSGNPSTIRVVEHAVDVAIANSAGDKRLLRVSSFQIAGVEVDLLTRLQVDCHRVLGRLAGIVKRRKSELVPAVRQARPSAAISRWPVPRFRRFSWRRPLTWRVGAASLSLVAAPASRHVFPAPHAWPCRCLPSLDAARPADTREPPRLHGSRRRRSLSSARRRRALVRGRHRLRVRPLPLIALCQACSFLPPSKVSKRIGQSLTTVCQA